MEQTLVQPQTLIRFYGLQASLEAWRKVVAARVQKEGSAVQFKGNKATGTHYFDVPLTQAERKTLMQDWYDQSGTGSNAQGVPYRWNDCVGYEEVQTKLDGVLVEQQDKGFTVWARYAGVDRPVTSGISCGPNRKLAERLRQAVLAGKAINRKAKVLVDVDGKTYADSTWEVMGRYLNADLKRLGY
jgi:hypothetical protein